MISIYKAIFVATIVASVSANPDDDRAIGLDFLGVTDRSAMDIIMGTMSGFYGEDLRPRYNPCLYGFWLKIFHLFYMLDDLETWWWNIFKLTAHIDEAEDAYNLTFEIFGQLPADIKACQPMINDIPEFAWFIWDHLTLNELPTILKNSLFSFGPIA